MSFGGGGGIRTLGRFAPTLDFESSTFDHSATPPVSFCCVICAALLRRFADYIGAEILSVPM
jgi:hypothetical protein